MRKKAAPRRIHPMLVRPHPPRSIHNASSTPIEKVPVVEKYILKAAFRHQCKYLLQVVSSHEDGTPQYLIQPGAIDALQQNAEEFLEEFFADARLAMLHRVRSRKGRGEGELLTIDL